MAVFDFVNNSPHKLWRRFFTKDAGDEHRFTLYEETPVDLLQWLVENVPQERTQVKEQLRYMITATDAGSGLAKVVYKQCDFSQYNWNGPKNVGRYYARYPNSNKVNDKSMQELWHSARNTILHYTGWSDYDFVNCHPTLLVQLFYYLRDKTPALVRYAEDRDGVFQEFTEHTGLPGKLCKKLVTPLIFGSHRLCDEDFFAEVQQAYKTELERKQVYCFTDFETCVSSFPFFTALRRDVALVGKEVETNYCDFYYNVAVPKAAEKSKEVGRTVNPHNTAVHFLCADVEQRCLREFKNVYAHLTGCKQRLVKGVNVYDGMPVPRLDHKTECELLRRTEEAILKNVGVRLKVVNKPLDDVIEGYCKKRPLEGEVGERHHKKKKTPCSTLWLSGVLQSIPPEVWESSWEDVLSLVRFIALHGDGIVGDYELLLLEVSHNLSHFSKEAFDKEPTSTYSDPIQSLLLYTNLKTYSRTKEQFEKSNFKLLNPLCFVRETASGECFYYTANHFHVLHQNVYYYEIGCTSEPLPVFVQKWVADPSIRTYEQEDFVPPPLVCPENVYNSWKGLRAESLPHVDNVEELVKPVLEHVNVLVNYDSVSAEYVLDWLAVKIQRPGELTRVALIFRSLEGAGKNVFFEFVGQQVIGERYYVEVDKVTELFDDLHTTARKDKLLIVVGEMQRSDSNKVHKDLNGLLTNPKTRFRAMHIAPVMRRNCAGVVAGAQDPNCIYAEGAQRRYAFFDCSPKFANDPVYFGELVPTLHRDDVARAFYQFLAARDVSNVNLSADRPTTSASVRMTAFSAKPVHRFLRDLLQAHVAYKNYDKEFRVLRSELKSDFKRWFIVKGEKHEDSPERFFFSDMNTVETDSQNAVVCRKFQGNYTYKFTTETMVAFIKKLGLPVQELQQDATEYDVGVANDDSSEVPVKDHSFFR